MGRKLARRDVLESVFWTPFAMARFLLPPDAGGGGGKSETAENPEMEAAAAAGVDGYLERFGRGDTSYIFTPNPSGVCSIFPRNCWQQ